MLNELGYSASVKAISSNIQFTYIQNTNNKVQISVSQWYQDYPAASDFLNVLFGCDSFHPGSDSSVNIAGFCDKEIEAKMKQDGDHRRPGQGRQALWTEIDKAVMDKAPAAPCSRPSMSTSSPSARQLPVQRAVLLDGLPVLGEVIAGMQCDVSADGAPSHPCAGPAHRSGGDCTRQSCPWSMS